MIDRDELQALRSARAGARWLFWCLLFVSVSAYGVLASSSTWSRLRDVHLIYESILTLGAIGYLIAVVLLTRNSSMMNGGRCAHAWRLTAIACLLYHGLRIWVMLDRFAWNWLAIVSIGVLLDIAFAAMGTVVLACILRRYNLHDRARQLEIACITYVLFLPCSMLSLGAEGEAWIRLGIIASLGLLVLIWSLSLLHSFVRAMDRLIHGRCADCGYDLTGLTEPRCPECGTIFDLQVSSATSNEPGDRILPEL